MTGLLRSAAVMLQVIVAERGALVFVFNFSPFHSFEGYKVSRRGFSASRGAAMPPTLVLHDWKAPTCFCLMDKAQAAICSMQLHDVKAEAHTCSCTT